jgi:hypothetical protein
MAKETVFEGETRQVSDSMTTNERTKQLESKKQLQKQLQGNSLIDQLSLELSNYFEKLTSFVVNIHQIITESRKIFNRLSCRQKNDLETVFNNTKKGRHSGKAKFLLFDPS